MALAHAPRENEKNNPAKINKSKTKQLSRNDLGRGLPTAKRVNMGTSMEVKAPRAVWSSKKGIGLNRSPKGFLPEVM